MEGRNLSFTLTLFKNNSYMVGQWLLESSVTAKYRRPGVNSRRGEAWAATELVKYKFDI